MRAPFVPLPLVRVPEPFDDPHYVYELKLDGFRALAFIADGRARLVSRNGHVFRRFDGLAAALGRELGGRGGRRAVLDGEIVCLDADGRADFDSLFYRRRQPIFAAFDLLSLGGRDLRQVQLMERKRRLRLLVPRKASSVLYVQHVWGRGARLFNTAVAHDLEGIVAKHGRAPYDSATAQWFKIKNRGYSQAEGRWERFERRAR